MIRRVRPRLSIWFHQQMAVVDESQGSVALERRFARLGGLPLARLRDDPGSVSVVGEPHPPAGRLRSSSNCRPGR